MNPSQLTVTQDSAMASNSSSEAHGPSQESSPHGHFSGFQIRNDVAGQVQDSGQNGDTGYGAEPLSAYFQHLRIPCPHCGRPGTPTRTVPCSQCMRETMSRIQQFTIQCSNCVDEEVSSLWRDAIPPEALSQSTFLGYVCTLCLGSREITVIVVDGWVVSPLELRTWTDEPGGQEP
jgi:hypothetical protein